MQNQTYLRKNAFIIFAEPLSSGTPLPPPIEISAGNKAGGLIRV